MVISNEPTKWPKKAKPTEKPTKQANNNKNKEKQSKGCTNSPGPKEIRPQMTRPTPMKPLQSTNPVEHPQRHCHPQLSTSCPPPKYLKSRANIKKIQAKQHRSQTRTNYENPGAPFNHTIKDDQIHFRPPKNHPELDETTPRHRIQTARCRIGKAHLTCRSTSMRRGLIRFPP